MARRLKAESRKTRADEANGAEALPSNVRAAAQGHNAGARKELIQKACRDIAALDVERKSIGEQIAAIKNGVIKGDLGMKVSDFNIAYRLYQLENEDRDTLLDTVRECFQALGVGEQLDWIKAAETGNGAADADGDEAARQAYFDGYEAGGTDRPERNPHPSGSNRAGEWDRGYRTRQEQSAAGMQ